jgi:hypothetical protein
MPASVERCSCSISKARRGWRIWTHLGERPTSADSGASEDLDKLMSNLRPMPFWQCPSGSVLLTALSEPRELSAGDILTRRPYSTHSVIDNDWHA